MNTFIYMFIISLFCPSVSDGNVDDLVIWREFTEQMTSGELPDERLHPYSILEELRRQLKEFLKIIGSKVDKRELQNPLKIFHLGNQIY